MGRFIIGFMLLSALDSLLASLGVKEARAHSREVRGYAMSVATGQMQLARVPDEIRGEVSVLSARIADRIAKKAAKAATKAAKAATKAATKAAKAAAALAGRDYVIPDDVKDLAIPTLQHRVVLTPTAEIEGRNGKALIDALVAQVEAPR